MSVDLVTRLDARLRALQSAPAAGARGAGELAATLRREWPAMARADEVLAGLVAHIAADAMAGLPATVARLRGVLDAPGTTVALRHAVALALVYLVRRDDLIADDRPGRYGQLDDWLVLSLVLLALVDHPGLRRPLQAVWFAEPAPAARITADIAAWRQSTMAAIEAVMVLAPDDRRHALRQVHAGAMQCLERCVAEAARDPAALEAHTQALLRNPDLPREVMLGPADDSAWAAWEARAAREADEAESLARARAWAAWSRKPSAYVSPYVFGRLPGGGFVAMKRR